MAAVTAYSRTIPLEKQMQTLGRHYAKVMNPFLNCDAGDNCVELPNPPPVWRFIPEYLSWRKFTPIGAIRKDWIEDYQAQTRLWWDDLYVPDWNGNYIARSRNDSYEKNSYVKNSIQYSVTSSRCRNLALMGDADLGDVAYLRKYCYLYGGT